MYFITVLSKVGNFYSNILWNDSSIFSWKQIKFFENLNTPLENIWPYCAGDRSKPNPNSSGLFDGVTFKKEADDAQEVCNLSILLQLLSAMSLSTPLWLASCTCCNPHCWFSLLKQLVEKQNWNNILRFFYHFSL